MFRKITLALVAVAAVSATALAPTAASAKGGKWHNHGWGWGVGAGLVGTAIIADAAYSSCYVKRWVDTPYGPRLRRIYICD